MKEEQELGIGSKAQESGSLCDTFLLFRDYAECFSLSFMFEPRGRKAEMCGDRYKNQSFVFDIYHTSILATSLASKNEEKTLRAIHPSAIW